MAVKDRSGQKLKCHINSDWCVNGVLRETFCSYCKFKLLRGKRISNGEIEETLKNIIQSCKRKLTAQQRKLLLLLLLLLLLWRLGWFLTIHHASHNLQHTVHVDVVVVATALRLLLVHLIHGRHHCCHHLRLVHRLSAGAKWRCWWGSHHAWLHRWWGALARIWARLVWHHTRLLGRRLLVWHHPRLRLLRHALAHVVAVVHMHIPWSWVVVVSVVVVLVIVIVVSALGHAVGLRSVLRRVGRHLS